MTTCMTSTERGERVNLTCTTSTSMMPARSTGCFAAQTCQGTAPRRVRRVGVLIPTGAGRNRCGRSTAGARPRRGCTSTCERMPVLAFSGTSGGSSPPAGGYAAVMWRSCGGHAAVILRSCGGHAAHTRQSCANRTELPHVSVHVRAPQKVIRPQHADRTINALRALG